MKSWSGIRKILEQDRLAPSLHGRVRYFVTRYREAHDDEGRLAILVDGKELFRAHTFVLTSIDRGDWRAEWAKEPDLNYFEFWEKTFVRELYEGKGGPTRFFLAFEEYDTQDIEKSLTSENPLVRALAVVDRRVGKRRLKRFMEQGFSHEPEWLQAIYRLRLEAEGIFSEKSV
ncbi:MAG: hypothetical protein J5449_10610 [Oscillospiraceae bacterium]|nr:hypothetical protein [Oscillospiraceae bacterium]